MTLEVVRMAFATHTRSGSAVLMAGTSAQPISRGDDAANWRSGSVRGRSGMRVRQVAIGASNVADRLPVGRSHA